MDSLNNLLDINNTPTDVDLIYGSSVVNGHLGGVAIINDNFLHADNFFVFSGAWSLTLTNLDAGVYDVYYYAPSNPAVSTGAFSINGTAVASLTGQVGALIQGTNWDVLTGVTVGGANTLEISALGTSGARGLAALQIVSTSQVPIPAAVWMLAGGVAGLFGFARRRL